MSPPPTLHDTVKAQLASRQTAYVISAVLGFADLLWDVATVEEVFALEHAVLVDSATGPRRVALQRVGGEIRYYATTDRRPEATDPTCELGILRSEADAVGLCEGFVGRDRELADVSAERRVLSG